VNYINGPKTIFGFFLYFRPLRGAILNTRQIEDALDIPSDSDISGASDDSDEDELYLPPSELRQFSGYELDEEDDEVGAVEDVQESDEDMFGPSGDDGGHAVPLEDVLDDPESAPLILQQPGPSTKRRRASGRKKIERQWQEEDLPSQQLPASHIQPREMDDCDQDVQFFLKMFGENNIQLLTEQSNLHRQKECINRNRNIPAFTEKEIRQILGILMYMSIVHLPNMRAYWRKSLRIEMVASVMPRDRFDQIVSLLHLSDNDLQPGKNSPDYDRLYKVSNTILPYISVYQIRIPIGSGIHIPNADPDPVVQF